MEQEKYSTILVGGYSKKVVEKDNDIYKENNICRSNNIYKENNIYDNNHVYNHSNKNEKKKKMVRNSFISEKEKLNILENLRRINITKDEDISEISPKKNNLFPYHSFYINHMNKNEIQYCDINKDNMKHVHSCHNKQQEKNMKDMKDMKNMKNMKNMKDMKDMKDMKIYIYIYIYIYV
ncbi:hypothetical protein PFMALIP_05054 [Plasmodium falciparum MaliPS096_E11]|uniref:Uncharacterized protein n=1 Tax=Plasmodium falciparum MaliPS096_E11 TaxID=1036727 RepID=A0A024WK75_PLAFA|nr:hypothetical protein PFMALIP_05054 [Plasmodium falciparum MaliPS096_E11]